MVAFGLRFVASVCGLEAMPKLTESGLSHWDISRILELNSYFSVSLHYPSERRLSKDLLSSPSREAAVTNNLGCIDDGPSSVGARIAGGCAPNHPNLWENSGCSVKKIENILSCASDIQGANF